MFLTVTTGLELSFEGCLDAALESRAQKAREAERNSSSSSSRRRGRGPRLPFWRQKSASNPSAMPSMLRGSAGIEFCRKPTLCKLSRAADTDTNRPQEPSLLLCRTKRSLWLGVTQFVMGSAASQGTRHVVAGLDRAGGCV